MIGHGARRDDAIARPVPARRFGTSTQGVLSAAVLVSGSLLASRLLGLLRVTVFAGLFGTSPDMTAYNAAFRIPDFLFTIVAGGALSSAFVPVFAGLLERRREGDAWHVANTILNSLFLALVLLSVLAFIMAPQITRLLYPHFPTPVVSRTVDLTRIMLVQPVLLGMGGLFAAMQNSYRRFVLPAVAPVIYNAAIVVGAVLFGPHFGVDAAAWAVVVGAVLMFEIQIWGVAGESRLYRPSLSWRLPESLEVVRLMGPRLLGLSAFQLMLFVTFFLASAWVPGISVITYAWTLVMFPVGAIGSSLGVAVFPTLSRQSAAAEIHELARTVSSSLRGVFFLALPAMAGLILLRRPIVELLFAHGAFGPLSVSATVFALGFYALGIVPMTQIELVARAFYAMKDTRTPVMIAIIAAIADAVLCTILIHMVPKEQGPGALGLGTSLAVWLQILLLIRALKRRLPAALDRALVKVFTATVLATTGMSLAVFVMLRILATLSMGRGIFMALIETGACSTIGLAAYVGLARALRIPEVSRLTALLGRFSSRSRR
jgi:putative peptidoglycan lipid II flippase